MTTSPRGTEALSERRNARTRLTGSVCFYVRDKGSVSSSSKGESRGRQVEEGPTERGERRQGRDGKPLPTVLLAGGYRATGARGLREGDWTFWRTRVRTSGWGPACPPFESGGTTTRVALAHRRSHGGGGAGLPARRREQPHGDKRVVDRMAAKS
jgi:hypothetical protein